MDYRAGSKEGRMFSQARAKEGSSESPIHIYYVEDIIFQVKNWE